MGFFRRTPDEQPSGGKARSLDFDDERDLPRFEDLIDRFIMTMGTPQQFDGVLRKIAKEGGIDMRRIERGVVENTSDLAARPWRWVLLGTRAASRAGRHDLVLRACGVVAIWQIAFAPNLTMGDFFEVGLQGCPSDIEREIYGLGTAPTLAVSIADDVIVTTDGQGVTSTAGDIRAGIHQRLRELRV
jgi:hypothetical protein